MSMVAASPAAAASVRWIALGSRLIAAAVAVVDVVVLRWTPNESKSFSCSFARSKSIIFARVQCAVLLVGWRWRERKRRRRTTGPLVW